MASPSSDTSGGQTRLNPNTASLGELQTLPGVGPSLAERIVAARPFADADDLRRVPGIGPSALAAMRHRLTFDEPPAVPASTESEFVKDASARVEQAVQAAGERWARATGGRRLLVDAGLVGLAVLLSMCLSLSVLAGINGSLDTSRQRTVRGLVEAAAGLQAGLEAVQSQTESIAGQLQALEGLTGRMNAVEGEVEAMRADLEAKATQVAGMQSTVEAVSGRMAALSTDVGRTDSFLRGVSDLLKSLYPDPNSPPAATRTPTPIP